MKQEWKEKEGGERRGGVGRRKERVSAKAEEKKEEQEQ